MSSSEEELFSNGAYISKFNSFVEDDARMFLTSFSMIISVLLISFIFITIVNEWLLDNGLKIQKKANIRVISGMTIIEKKLKKPKTKKKIIEEEKDDNYQLEEDELDGGNDPGNTDMDSTMKGFRDKNSEKVPASEDNGSSVLTEGSDAGPSSSRSTISILQNSMKA